MPTINNFLRVGTLFLRIKDIFAISATDPTRIYIYLYSGAETKKFMIERGGVKHLTTLGINY